MQYTRQHLMVWRNNRKKNGKHKRSAPPAPHAHKKLQKAGTLVLSNPNDPASVLQPSRQVIRLVRGLVKQVERTAKQEARIEAQVSGAVKSLVARVERASKREARIEAQVGNAVRDLLTSVERKAKPAAAERDSDQ